MPKIFAIVAIIFIISSCEVQESNNIYEGPNVPADFNNQFNSNSFSKQELDRIIKKLSNILNIEVDLNKEIVINLEDKTISSLIDCGYMNNEVYVEYIDRIFGSKLDITIQFENIFNEGNYLITNKPIEYIFTSKETGTRWRFRTNSPKELLVGNPVYDDNPYRICLSKNKLESKIVNIFNNIKNE